MIVVFFTYIMKGDVIMKNSCEVCKYYLQSICGGVGKICEDYYEVPKIMENEKKYWEKEGDASRYRKKSFCNSSGSGFYIEYLN